VLQRTRNNPLQVRHPGVTTLMQRDFVLMRRAALICSKLPVLKELRLEESVRQFGGPLKVSPSSLYRRCNHAVLGVRYTP